MGSLISLCLPWVVGGLLAVRVTSITNGNWGIRVMTVGAASLLTMLAFAGSLPILDSLIALDFELVTSILWGGVGAVLFDCIRSSGVRSFWLQPPTQNLFSIISTSSLLLLMSVFAYFLAFQPLQAWDAIDFWIPHAKAFLMHVIGETAPEYIYSERHPLTVPALIAYYTYHGGDMGQAWKVPYICASVSSMLVLIGACRHLSINRFASGLALVIFITMPVLEVHAYLPGYLEPIISAIMLSSLLCFAVGYTQGMPFLTTTAFCLALLLPMLKNTGSFYAACLIASAAFVRLSDTGVIKKQWVGAAAIVGGVLVLGIVSQTPGLLFDVIYVGDRFVILYAAKQLVVEPELWRQAIFANLQSYVLNQTFSVAAPMFIVLLVCWGGCSRTLPTAEATLPVIIRLMSYCIVLGLLGLFFSLLTDYGARFGFVGKDTGHSRFSLPFIALAISSFPFCAELLSRHHPLKKAVT